MPGTFVAQSGQMGAQSSLFVRGGDSTSNKVLVDGVDAGDLGGGFDFGPLSTTAVESAEVYRGPDSDLYGADADQRRCQPDHSSWHHQLSLALVPRRCGQASILRTKSCSLPARKGKLDYLGAFNWLQTQNNLPNDEYHVATAAGKHRLAPSGTTQLRATAHYGVDGTGVPNAWDFYHVADSATEKDQDLYVSGSIDNQTTADLHQTARYGMTRKREQYNLWSPSGVLLTYDSFGDQAYYGDPEVITGANGYSVSGRAILDFPGTYPQGHQLVSNRDQILYQASYAFTPHITGAIGFHYEDERGAAPNSTYLTPVERRNYDYIAAVHGDYKNRFFYNLSGSLERYSLFGTQTPARAGVSYYILRPQLWSLQRHAHPLQLRRCRARAGADRPVLLALQLPSGKRRAVDGAATGHYALAGAVHAHL